MKIHKKLLLALGILATTQAVQATTLHLTGYVDMVSITTDLGGFSSNPVSTGMTVSATLNFDHTTIPYQTSSNAVASGASYATGTLQVTIGDTLHLWTVASPDGYYATSVWDNATYYDELRYSAAGSNALVDDWGLTSLSTIQPASKSVSLTLWTPTYTALTSTELPSAELAESIFSRGQIILIFGDGSEIPCGDGFCVRSNYYQVYANITSISAVPLPPSLLLMGSSLSLLALGKHKRRRTAKA